MNMKKKILGVCIAVVLAVSLTSCKSIDYDNAVSAIKNEDYETAFELLADLDDYKDSKQLLSENINIYVANLVEDDNYDDAIRILDKYHVASDFGDLYNDLVEQKELYDAYSQADDCFSSGKIEEGFAFLDTLPKDYRNVQRIYDSYNALKDCIFIGSYTNNPSKRDSSINSLLRQSIKFELDYHSEEFQLHVYKKVYWADDGTISDDFTYYVDTNDIDGNTIECGALNISTGKPNYIWTIDDNGQFIEVEKGKTYIYD